jgi:hypothetical protein
MLELKRLDIFSNTNCNFSCSNCAAYCRQRSFTENYDVEIYLEPLKHLQTYAHINWIDIYGGEPTLHPDISNFITKIKSSVSNNTLIELTSNGWWMPNEDRYRYLWELIGKLGQGIHPELLKRLSLEDIRLCMKRIRDKYNIITDLYLDSSFACFAFTDIPNNTRDRCRFDKCTILMPNGILSRCGILQSVPENLASINFNKYKSSSFFNIFEGNEKSLNEWLNKTPECCKYCTGDTIKVPHFGYETTVIQEYKYPGDE